MVQVAAEHVHEALGMLLAGNVVSYLLGTISTGRYLTVDDTLSFDIDRLRNLWYRPSYLMDRRQTHPQKALERYNHYAKLPLTFRFPASFTGRIAPDAPDLNKALRSGAAQPPIAAVIREKGSQSEREMAWMLHMAGFRVRDVHMTDLISGAETLEDVRLIAFVGGSAHADVFGSAKGWAGTFLYNPKAKETLERFYAREDTLSIGVCNGCQLMMQLGLVTAMDTQQSPRMLPNDSGKFECGFVNVDVEDSPSVFRLEGQLIGIVDCAEKPFRRNWKQPKLPGSHAVYMTCTQSQRLGQVAAVMFRTSPGHDAASERRPSLNWDIIHRSRPMKCLLDFSLQRP